jgi:acetyl esterase
MIDKRIEHLAPSVNGPDPALSLLQWRADNDALGLKLGGEPVPVQQVLDLNVTARDGHLIPIKIYIPNQLKLRAAVYVYAHGGGWVIGSTSGTDRVTRALADRAQSIVISVDYRMAPEFAFPVPINDVEDVLFWTKSESALQAVRRQTIILAGDSAGAHLAIAVSYRQVDARRSSELQTPKIGGVLAIYPCLDPACDSPTMRAFGIDHGLTQSRMKWFWECTLAGQKPSAQITPWLRTDLSDAPPTWIVTAQYDPLRAEAESFALRLMQAGVKTSLEMQPGMLHGFMRWRGLVPNGHQSLCNAVAWFEQSA